MQRIVDVVNGDAQRLRFTLIDIDLQLRTVVEPVMADPGQQRVFAGQLKQRIACRHQRIVPLTGVILKLHIEACRTAEAADGRRAAGDDPRFVDLIKRFGGAFNNGKGGAGFRVALVPVFETHKHAGHVLPVAAGAGANGSEHRLDVLLLVIEEVIFRLLHHLQRLLLGAAARQLDRGGEHPAILQRQERGGQMQEQEHHPAEQDDVDQHPAQRAVKNFADKGFVAAGAAVEGAVEPAEEAFSFMGFTWLNRLKQRGAKGRGEDHGHQHREDHRRDDSD